MLMLLIAIGISTLFYIFVIKPFTYWTKKGIDQYPVWKIWWETAKVIFQRESLTENTKKIYAALSDKRYFGGYQFFNPTLLIRDPELVKKITVKDFDHFVDRKQMISEETDSLWSKILFLLQDDKWRDMRGALTPAFTGSKMKMMFGLMSECADNFVQYFKNADSSSVKLKDAYAMYINDVIASVVFGLTCNSLQDHNNEFLVMGKEITDFQAVRRKINLMLVMFFPKMARLLGITIFGQKVMTFFKELVVGSIENREKNGIVRPDVIHLLMELKNTRLKEIQDFEKDAENILPKAEFTDDELTAQALLFFFAGFAGVSTLMCFTSYELVVDPLVQKKLQEEIDATWEKCDGQLTYEALKKMEYLDMVISESLRKWSTGVVIDRMCVKPYTIEPEHEEEKPLRLKEGDCISIPIIGIHYDEKFYPEPNRFDPERFSPKNKENIHPYSYIPFGCGPRNCIGKRFALQKSKILIFHLLRNFDIVPTHKSVIPIKLSKKQFGLEAEGGFWFGFSPRQKYL